jgi:hypothetical protein
MGNRGPVPKRTSERRRTNEPEIPVVTALGAAKVPIPRADGSWHPVALAWYKSLAKSGQASYYEPSDWATAFLIAESMSRDLSPQVVGFTDSGKILKESIPLKGASLSAYLKAMGSLMVTEGDRRRAMLELERPKPSDPDADRAMGTITELRSRLTGG